MCEASGWGQPHVPALLPHTGTTGEVLAARLRLTAAGISGGTLSEQATNAASELAALRELAGAVARFERTLDGHPWDQVPPEWSLVSALLDRTHTPR